MERLACWLLLLLLLDFCNDKFCGVVVDVVVVVVVVGVFSFVVVVSFVGAGVCGEGVVGVGVSLFACVVSLLISCLDSFLQQSLPPRVLTPTLGTASRGTPHVVVVVIADVSCQKSRGIQSQTLFHIP